MRAQYNLTTQTRHPTHENGCHIAREHSGTQLLQGFLSAVWVHRVCAFVALLILYYRALCHQTITCCSEQETIKYDTDTPTNQFSPEGRHY